MPSLYDYPAIYDAVMRASTSQIDLEIEVIHALLQERGMTTGRILEIGSGTSPHGLALAQKGHAVVGIDRSRAMVAYARKAAQEAGVGARYVRADLRDFALKEAPFDGAVFMADTFTLVTEYADLASHFDAVRRHLKPGGFYLIDVDAQQAGYRHVHKVWGQQIVALPDGHAELWYEDQPAD